MKKQFKKLLSQPEGKLKINEFFYLYRWTEDALGNEVDGLSLEMSPRSMSSVRITSRDCESMMEEIIAGMEKMMDSVKEDFIRKFKGGLLG